MMIFKRRFGDFLSMAKTRCEWDALKVNHSTQKLHEFLDVLQKTAEEASGTEAQQFIDKTLYAKMPDHVKKILNRAYLILHGQTVQRHRTPPRKRDAT